MRRIIVEKGGGLDALRLIEEPDPVPKDGETLVDVTHCGVNYADVIVRMGHYEAAKGRYPITPGFEFAGRDQAGRRVFGVTFFGGYASRIASRFVWGTPEGWSDEQAAGFPAVFLTAYHGLFNVAKVSKGETILIHSAAGGVGLALTRLARIAGCRTVGIASGGKPVETDARGTLWDGVDRAAPDGLDVIFDANGVTTPRPGFKRLKPGGRLVVYGFAEIVPKAAHNPSLLSLAWNWLRVPRFSPLEMTTTNRAVMGFNLAFLFGNPALTEAMDRLLEMKVKPLPTTVFPFERAADAHAALESGKTMGKLVLGFQTRT